MNYLPTSIGILGTCVSVDLFEFAEHKDLVNKTALRDFSVFNTWDKRPSVNIGKIVHSSSLHTMWLNTLWDGHAIDFIKENMGEYLLIDLTDERFDMFMVDGCYFNKHYFMQTRLFDALKSHGIEYDICSQTDFNEDEARKRIRCFCDMIKTVYLPEQIIINKFFLVDKFVKDGKTDKFSREDELRLIAKSNLYFAHWYDLLEKELPGCKTIKFARNYNADYYNKRGCSPCHLTSDYYSSTIEQLQKIVDDDHAKRRCIEIQKLTFPPERLSIEELKKLGADDYLSRLFEKILRLTDIKGKVILYAGNRAFAHDFVRKMQVKKFVQIFNDSPAILNSKRNVYNFSDNYMPPHYELHERNFAFYCGELSDITEDFLDFYDIIIVEDMEEISELPGVLDNLYKCLKNGGQLIGKTGRTWSCNGGNKWFINKELNYLKQDKIIPLFSHLLSNYEEIRKALAVYIQNDAELSNAAAKMVGSNCLNHLFYEDYEKILQKSLFSEKWICPMFFDDVPDNIMEALLRKYPQYKRVNFEYRSLYIYCKK